MKSNSNFRILGCGICGVTVLAFLMRALGADFTVSPDVIGSSGDIEIKINDVLAYIETLCVPDQQKLAQDPALLNQALRSLLVQRLIYKEALAKQWDQHKPSRTRWSMPG